MSAAVEAPKHPVKMSFWSEEHGAKVAAVQDPGPAAWAAARRLIARQPDGEQLAAMVFGIPA